ncbi:TIGR03545 family protein [Gracilinema caldarium]|uniref:TIGR03545 family protein n=1 Tax=Gracilinema caldarium (strain ATCC 51460 / DSM 7334 / H1) TaxID=744872 RepID=F8EXU0_GRAC1|nr:TIGR03545 family protein [Gracilinema caldarium]AEJ20104.1 Conserved hypothetical protein CHP03545 [Gracilinema caldarium DSM 7334]
MAQKIKIPSLFKKPLKEKVFQHKVLKKIYIKADVDFINQLFFKNENGYYQLKDTISQADANRLKKIADAVKKNKGVIDPVRIGILLFLLGTVVVFSLFFKNSLAKTMIERGLESIFNAKVEAQGVQVGLVKAHISLNRLVIASDTEPFKNLVEFGKTEVRLLTSELFRGKIIIQNIECQNIQWGTDRKTDGRLKKRTDSSIPKQPKDNKLVQNLLDFSNIPVERIIEEQTANLKSLQLYNDLNTEIEKSKLKWETTLQESKNDIEVVKNNIDEVKKINVASIKSFNEAQEAYNKVNALYPMVQDLQVKTSQINKDITAEYKNIELKSKEAKDSITKDIDYLKSFLNFSNGKTTGIVGQIVSAYLEEKLGKLYVYAMKGLELSKNIKTNKDEKKVKKVEPQRKGYSVYFPTKNYPRLLIENIGFSTKDSKTKVSNIGWIKDISNDPDVWGKPVTMLFNQTHDSKSFLINGYIDGRTNSENSLSATIEMQGYPFTIDEGLDSIGLKSITGTYAVKNTFAVKQEGSVIGSADVSTHSAHIETADPNHIVAKGLVKAFHETPVISLHVEYVIHQNRTISMNIGSNLDTVLANAFSKIFNEMTQEAEVQLTQAFYNKLEPELKKNKEVSEAYKLLNIDSLEKIKDVKALEDTLTAKKKELDSYSNKMKNQAADKIKDQVKDQIKEIPKIPKF